MTAGLTNGQLNQEDRLCITLSSPWKPIGYH